jgi:hypothetical protein
MVKQQVPCHATCTTAQPTCHNALPSIPNQATTVKSVNIHQQGCLLKRAVRRFVGFLPLALLTRNFLLLRLQANIQSPTFQTEHKHTCSSTSQSRNPGIINKPNQLTPDSIEAPGKAPGHEKTANS